MRRLACGSFIAVSVALGACAPAPGTTQLAAQDWVAVVPEPAFSSGQGPLVLVDSAHGNWHTIEGRFEPFARLLEKDGYRVRSSATPITAEALSGADVFVIANAIKGGESAEWVLPTPAALEPEETRALVTWVEEGGSLLLIADHMPFPGAVDELAQAFGLRFLNGFAVKSASEGGVVVFTRAGGLVDHAVTRGRNAAEAVPAVKTFTGQAFSSTKPFEPLIRMPDDWVVLLPQEAWKFAADTPQVSTRGLVQGAVLRHGKGRVAAFGEAAMFTAQTITRPDGSVARAGLNDPEAPHNAQFVLNVLHWLAGLLDS